VAEWDSTAKRWGGEVPPSTTLFGPLQERAEALTVTTDEGSDVPIVFRDITKKLYFLPVVRSEILIIGTEVFNCLSLQKRGQKKH